LLLTGACQDRSSPCQLAVDEERYSEAAILCEEEFAADASPEAASGAARAHYFLGDEREVFGWAERAKGTAAESRVLALTAGIHHQRGDGARERQALERSLALFLEEEEWGPAAWSLHGLAYQAWQESRYQEALEQAEQAEDLANKAEDPELRRLAGELQYSVLYAVGDLRGARRVLERARPLLEDQPKIYSARWHHHDAGLLLDSGRPTLARAASLRALELMESAVDSYGKDPLLPRSIHLNLVKISLRLGDLEIARQHLEAAWSHVEDGADRTALLFYRAQIAQRSGHFRAASEDLRKALAEDPVADWKWELELELGISLEELGELAAAEESLRRSAATVEDLRNSLGLDDLKPWLLERKRRPFEALLLLLVAQHRDIEALEVAERARARNLLDALVQSQAVHQASSRDRISLLEGWLPGPLSSPDTPAARGSQAKALQGLGERNVAIFFDAGQEIWKLTRAGKVARWRPLPWTAEELGGKVEDFLADVDDEDAALELGKGLLSLEELSLSHGPLYLLPDGPLTDLPFAALRIDGSPIVERFPLVYLPRLSLPSQLAERALPRKTADTKGAALVLGDPLGDLPFARREAQEVAALLGSETLRLGAEATLESLAETGPLDLLHLATHTGLGPSGPWITLAGGPVPVGKLLAVNSPARLAILASCASAAQPTRELWGSLAAAFLVAGTPSVLATSRSVGDSQTLELIRRFYEEGGHLHPAEALARAQAALSAEGMPPASWSPFLLLSHSIHGDTLPP